MKNLLAAVRAGALLHQLAHLGDGHDRIDFFLGKAQRQTQIRVRIDVRGEYGAPFVGIQPCEDGGEGGFSDAALSGDGYFHN